MTKRLIAIYLSALLLLLAGCRAAGTAPGSSESGSGKETEETASSASSTSSGSGETETGETDAPEPTPAVKDPTEAGNCADLQTDSLGFAVVDDDGELFLGRNMYEPYRPASITKVLTALVTVELVSLDNQVTIPEKAVTEHLGVLSSGVRPSFKPGETVTVRDLLHALILPSTNAAGNILAFYVAGSIEAFTDLMNDKCRELGLTHSHFANPHGMDEDGHYTCAYDMAVILKEAVKHEELKKILGTLNYTIPATEYSAYRSMGNTNAILDGRYPVKGAFAGKPGNTYGAKGTLVTAVERNGKRFYICTMHADEGVFVYEDTQNVAEYAFARYFGTKTKLIAFAHNITVTVADDAGLTITYATEHNAVDSRVVYWDLRQGTGTAVYHQNLGTGQNVTCRLTPKAKGTYSLQVWTRDAEGVEHQTQTQFLFDGRMHEEGLQDWNGRKYVTDANGMLRLGAIETADGCYYANAGGDLGKGFIGQFYAGPDYKLVSGWITTGGCRFYCQADGRLAKGKLIIDGVLHTFSESGMLLE